KMGWQRKLMFMQLILVSVFLSVQPTHSEDPKLRISLTEKDLYKFGDKAYVRVYQAVVGAIPGASETKFPSKFRFKDIWQDRQGRIIMLPAGTKDPVNSKLWIGIGDPRNQLKFMKRYLKEGKNPLIRSFLVPYETVRKVLNPKRICTKDSHPNSGLSMNVDQNDYANQFGLNRLDADELRKNAVPESLVTFATKIDDTEPHWGILLDKEVLKNDFNKNKPIQSQLGDVNLKNAKDLKFNEIPSIEKDYMFSGRPFDDSYFESIIQKGKTYKLEFENSRTFLSCVEAYSRKLVSILKDDNSRSLNAIRRYRSERDLWGVLKDVDQNLDLTKIELGFFGEGNLDVETRLRELTNRLTNKITSALTKRAISHTMNKFSQRMINEMNDMIKPSYKLEVIFQLGTSDAVDKASKYLHQRYANEGKLVQHIILDENGNIEGKRKGNGNINLDYFRLNVIGHGEIKDSSFTIGGKHPNELANYVKDLVSQDLGAQSESSHNLKKVSLIACNTALDNDKAKIASTYGLRFLEALETHNTEVTVRTDEVQITIDGNKVYGPGTDLRIRKDPPVLVRKNVDGTTEYGLINLETKKPTWSTNEPSDLSYRKMLLKKSFHQNDINEIVEKTNLRKNYIFYNGKDTSGNLNLRDFDQPGVQSVLTDIDSAEWVEKLTYATAEATKDMPDSSDWIPLIDTASKQENGNTKVTIFNSDTLETRSVEIKNDAFVQYKKRSSSHKMSPRYPPKISKWSIGMDGTGGLLGIGGFIMSAIELSKSKKCEENVTCPTNKKLAKSLEINAYVGIAFGGFGSISDSIQLAELAVGYKLGKQAVKGITTLTKTTSKFLQFSKVFGAVGMGVGVAGGIVGLGFSSYALDHAETDAQRIQFGVQVGIDSISTAVSVVGLVATFAGSSAIASSIAAAAGPVGFVVAIVGILTSTITGLTFEFINTRDNARQVGKYFHTLDNVYGRNGFDYDASTKVLKLLNDAIVESVDFRYGRIKLDSQFIYRTEHGPTGSGRINYFFWYGDFPVMIKNKNEAINIRNGIGHVRSAPLGGAETSAETLVLPAIPKSYISYSYGRLPFCTTMHDEGFDVVRRLEDNRFDYDFYIFPGEQIINSINHEYVDTMLTINLDNSNVKTILVPDINSYEYLHNRYTFKIKTLGVKHDIILSDYYSFILERMSNTPCIWYLRFTDIDFHEVSIQNSILRIKHILVEITHRSDIIYLSDGNGILQIDLEKNTKTLVSVFHDEETSLRELKRYLGDMDGSWLKNQKYVVISNFTQNGAYVGRVFYDTKSRIFLYTDLHGVGVSSKFKDNVQLLGSYQGKYQRNVYFMSEEYDNTVVWRTDIKTKRVVASYVLYCGNYNFKISKLYQQQETSYLIQNVYDVSLIYLINAHDIKLIAIDGKIGNIVKLADSCFPSLKDYLPGTERQEASFRFPGKCLHATTVPILPVKQTLGNGKSRRFWLYMNATDQNEGTKGDIFCIPNKPPIATGVITPHIPNE
ncbi:unnamed protein product, partial [Owenia fusiformis]